jgi:hypothetical protein
MATMVESEIPSSSEGEIPLNWQKVHFPNIHVYQSTDVE